MLHWLLACQLIALHYLPCRVSCPAYRVPGELMAKHEQLVFAALAALRPVAPLLDVVLSVQQQLRQAGGGGSHAYTVVHLKVEDAWIAQCAAWAAKGACVASGAHVMWKRRPVAVHVGHSGLMQ